MRVIHGLQEQVAVRCLLTEEDIVVIGLALTARCVTVAVQDPGVEDDQSADVWGLISRLSGCPYRSRVRPTPPA